MTINESAHDKTNKMAGAPSEDSDQPGHTPSLIRVFAVRMKRVWILSYMYPLSAQQRLRSDWTDAQADMSLSWAHLLFCWVFHAQAKCVVKILLKKTDTLSGRQLSQNCFESLLQSGLL